MRASFVFLASVFAWGLYATPALAEGIAPLVNLPGADSAAAGGAELGTYINALYNIAVSIAGVLAVIMIIIGGFQYMTSEAISGKSQGREYITSAIFGLVLLLGSYILLNIINPRILQFELLRALERNSIETTTSAGLLGNGGLRGFRDSITNYQAGTDVIFRNAEGDEVGRIDGEDTQFRVTLRDETDRAEIESIARDRCGQVYPGGRLSRIPSGWVCRTAEAQAELDFCLQNPTSYQCTGPFGGI